MSLLSPPVAPARPSSRASSLQIVPPEVFEGIRVQVLGKHLGVVRFIGTSEFSVGQWIGVELDLPDGKNDGTVQNIRYFTCKPLHGIFARPGAVRTEASLAAAQVATTGMLDGEAHEVATSAATSGSRPTLTAVMPAPAPATPAAAPARVPATAAAQNVGLEAAAEASCSAGSDSRPSAFAASTGRRLSPKSGLHRRNSTDIDLRTSICVHGRADVLDALSSCCGEVQRLQAAVRYLGDGLRAATEASAPPNIEDSAKATQEAAMEAWLAAASERMGKRLEEKLCRSLEQRLAAVTAGPLAELHQVAADLRQFQPGVR